MAKLNEILKITFYKWGVYPLLFFVILHRCSYCNTVTLLHDQIDQPIHNKTMQSYLII